MTAIISWGFILAFLFSLLASSFSNYPYYKVSPGPIGLASLMALWILMFVDFIRNKTLPRKVWWGLLLILCSWVGGVVYFLCVYHPRNKISFIDSIKDSDPAMYKRGLAVFVCASVTILHSFLFSTIYLVFGIPFPEAYDLIVNKILYFPVSAFLSTVTTMLDMNLYDEANEKVAFLVQITNFLYTMCLYLVVYCLFAKLKKTKRLGTI